MQRLPLILFVISFILIVTIGIISVQNSLEFIKTERDISRTNQISSELEEINSLYKDLFISSREYIITGDSVDLINLTQFDLDVRSRLESLQAIITDSVLQADLNQLRILMSQRLETFTTRTILIRKNEGFEAAQKYFIANNNQILIQSEIPQLIRKIKAREDKLLQDRTALSNKTRKTTIFIIILGTVVSIMAVLIGLFFTRKSKLELDVVNQVLQQHNNKLLNFSHIATHNLRSPVNNLNSLLSFYKQSKDEEDRRILIEKFETVIHHLTASLNELMETLRIQEDTEKTRELIKFEDIFTKTKETLAGSILETGSKITADFSKARKIEYDRSYLESIMLNLLSNAIKYRSPERTPEIHFQTKCNNGQVILTVSDNGLGIDLQAYGDKLFNLNKTFHEHPEAKGVGLFITRTQVEAMGGSISAESKVDKGTTFTVVFNRHKKK